MRGALFRQLWGGGFHQAVNFVFADERSEPRSRFIFGAKRQPKRLREIEAVKVEVEL